MPVEVHKVATVVAAYWTTSISMVFANKYLVGGRNTEDISLFVSWFQCMMTVMLVVGFKVMRGWRNEKNESWLTVAQLRTTMLATPVLAMSGFFVGMLSFNNMCLKLVGVSFYQRMQACSVRRHLSHFVSRFRRDAARGHVVTSSDHVVVSTHSLDDDVRRRSTFRNNTVELHPVFLLLFNKTNKQTMAVYTSHQFANGRIVRNSRLQKLQMSVASSSSRDSASPSTRRQGRGFASRDGEVPPETSWSTSSTSGYVCCECVTSRSDHAHCTQSMREANKSESREDIRIDPRCPASARIAEHRQVGDRDRPSRRAEAPCQLLSPGARTEASSCPLQRRPSAN